MDIVNYQNKVYEQALRKNYTLEVSADRTDELISELFLFGGCEKFCCYLEQENKSSEIIF